MKRAPLGLSVVGIAALALSPLALTAPAQAIASPGTLAAMATGQHGPDRSYTPAERRADMNAASSDRAQTAKELHLGSQEALVVKDVTQDADGAEHVRYNRTFDGLPVIGGDLVVSQTTNGGIRQVDWASQEKIAPTTTTATVAAPANSRKVVYAVNHKPVVAWERTVTGADDDGTPIRNLVYTDARTGKQLGVLPQIQDASGTGNSLYSGSVPVETTLSGSTYNMTDGLRGGHSTYDANNSTSTARGTLFTDADNVWGNGTTSSRQSAAVDAHFGAAETWDFYKLTYGRTGIKNDGVAAYSRVHYGSAYENAFWDDTCFCMTYGDGGTTLSTLTSLDVAGHEMTHGVTSNTAGLNYSGESGGLNEATSDVFGTMVEFYANNASDPGDYYIGEKIAKDGTYLRRMDNPSLDGGSANCWSSTVGNLDVHYSSGVGNHLFYLLSEGTGAKTIGGRAHSATSCNGTTLTGIGRDAAAKIWYRALTTYWTSTTNYAGAANGMVKAAKDLYGASSTQCTATVAAWKGVSVTPTEACTTGGGGGTNLLANPGFESGATSWTQTTGVITNSTSGTPRTGSYYAWLDGYGTATTDYVQQSVTIPVAASATLSFYTNISTSESGTTPYDTLKVQVISGGVTTTLATYSNADASAGYVARSVNLSAYTGKTVTVKFLGVEDSSLATSFLLDDTSLTTA